MNGDTKYMICPDGQPLDEEAKRLILPSRDLLRLLRLSLWNVPLFALQAIENSEQAVFCSLSTKSKKGMTMCTTCPFGEVLMRYGTCGMPGTAYDRFSLKCSNAGH